MPLLEKSASWLENVMNVAVSRRPPVGRGVLRVGEWYVVARFAAVVDGPMSRVGWVGLRVGAGCCFAFVLMFFNGRFRAMPLKCFYLCFFFLLSFLFCYLLLVECFVKVVSA